MSIFRPIETTSSMIDTIPIVHGQYIFCSDSGEVFIDTTKGQRIAVNKPMSVKKSTSTFTSSTDSVNINIEGFDSETDTLLVYLNSVYLDEGSDYMIDKETNTITNITDGEWISSESAPSIFNFIAFCNIPVNNAKTKQINIIDDANTQQNYNCEKDNEIILLKYDNALLIYTMMINNLNVSNILSEDKILYFYINKLWTKEMVYEAIDCGLIKKERFEQII